MCGINNWCWEGENKVLPVVVAQCLDVHASLGQVNVSCEPAKECKGTCRGFVAVVDVVHVKGRADLQKVVRNRAKRIRIDSHFTVLGVHLH